MEREKSNLRYLNASLICTMDEWKKEPMMMEHCFVAVRTAADVVVFEYG